MKGALEEAVKKLNFPRLLIFQPSILIRSNNDRGAENFSVKAIHFLNKIGLFKRYRPMPTNVLAQRIRREVATATEGVHTFTLDEIFLK
jgi:hypothetical protein